MLALIIGLAIILMPIILFILGFCLMMAFLAIIGRFVGSWIRY